MQIEKKLLVSAQTLLEVTQDPGKREKLTAAIATREQNVKSLRLQLLELKGVCVCVCVCVCECECECCELVMCVTDSLLDSLSLGGLPEKWCLPL